MYVDKRSYQQLLAKIEDINSLMVQLDFHYLEDELLSAAQSAQERSSAALQKARTARRVLYKTDRLTLPE